MKESYCGYDCRTCLGLIAFQITSREEQDEYFKNHTGVIPCAGCKAIDNICEKTCGTCSMRLCGMQKNIETCSECNEYPCSYYKKN